MKIRKNVSTVIFLIVLGSLIPYNSFGSEGLFGPEWTFTNPEVFRNDLKFNENKRKEFTELILKKCPSCTYTEQDSKIQVNKDLSIVIDTDFHVIEVNTSPLTVKKIKKYKKVLQKLVFDSAKELGLKPHYRLGGGHIHLDKISHFKESKHLERNFIVDLFNHSELFLGALSHDYLNAKPVAVLSDSALNNLEKIIEAYDKGSLSWKGFLDKIQSHVYSIRDNNPQSLRMNPKKNHIDLKFNEPKFQAVNLEHRNTIEVRGFQPQQNIEQYISMVELLESRIRFLEANFKKIEKTPYIKKSYKNQWSVIESRASHLKPMEHLHSYAVHPEPLHMYKTYVDPESILDTYKGFVEGTGNLYRSYKGKDFEFKESGLSWSDYKPYIADKRLKAFLKEQDKREQKRRSVNQKNKGSCNMLLSN